MPESGWTIPDDWDAETWTAYCIQWPDSPKFKLLLRSILYHLTRATQWDKYTGNIIEAKYIGWEIFDRNNPLQLCSDACPDCPECPEPPVGQDGAVGGGALIESEGDMGQVVTDVTVENGVLTVWFGPCCSRALGPLQASGVTPEVVENPLDPNNTGTVTYSACGKAIAIVEALSTVLEAAFQVVSEGDIYFFPTWPGQLEAAVEYNLQDKYVVELLTLYVLAGTIVSPEEVFSPDQQQTAICRVVQLFGDDSLGVPSDADYNAIKSAILTQNLVYDAIVGAAINALGQGGLDRIAKLGAGNLTGNCDCPAATQIVDPTTNWAGVTWSHFWDFTTEDIPAWANFGTQEPVAYRVPGVGVVGMIATNGYRKLEIDWPFAPIPAGTITRLYFLYKVPGSFNYTGLNSLYGENIGDVSLGDPGWYDSDPSIGGLITVNAFGLTMAIGGTANHFFTIVEGTAANHDQVTANCPIIVAFGIGGTGTDPFSGH